MTAQYLIPFASQLIVTTQRNLLPKSSRTLVMNDSEGQRSPEIVLVLDALSRKVLSGRLFDRFRYTSATLIIPHSTLLSQCYSTEVLVQGVATHQADSHHISGNGNTTRTPPAYSGQV